MPGIQLHDIVRTRSTHHSADLVSGLLLLKLSNELFCYMPTCYLNCENSVLVDTKVTRLCNKLFEESVIIAIVPIIVQQDATIYSLFISVNRATCFGWLSPPITRSSCHCTHSISCHERDSTGTAFTSSHVHDRLQLWLY